MSEKNSWVGSRSKRERKKKVIVMIFFSWRKEEGEKIVGVIFLREKVRKGVGWSFIKIVNNCALNACSFLFNLDTFLFGSSFLMITLLLYLYKVKCPIIISHFCLPCGTSTNKLTHLKPQPTPFFSIFLFTFCISYSPLFRISLLALLLFHLFLGSCEKQFV